MKKLFKGFKGSNLLVVALIMAANVISLESSAFFFGEPKMPESLIK